LGQRVLDQWDQQIYQNLFPSPRLFLIAAVTGIGFNQANGKGYLWETEYIKGQIALFVYLDQIPMLMISFCRHGHFTGARRI
jgi:hypothetical protein